MQMYYIFFTSLVNNTMFSSSIKYCSVFCCLTSLSLLSSHSTHSSDEAGFNDLSLLENLQSNHVSNVRVPCHSPAVMAAV